MNKGLANAIYLIVERIRKENVLGVLAELEETQWYSTDHLLDLQWHKFKKLLRYAYDEIPFYTARFKEAGIEPEDIKTREDMQAIPVLTKPQIRENFDTIVSKCITRTEQLSTSGSMAEPLMMIRCRDSMAYHRANMFRFRRWYDCGIGGFEATFRGTNFPFNMLLKLRVKDFLLNRKRVPERNLSKENLDRYFREMLRARPETFYGFPTLIEKFTSHLIESGVPPKPFPTLKCVIPSSEMAYPWQKVKWREYYGVPVAEEYGCTEAGILAIECPHGSWHIPVESCLIEYVTLDNPAIEQPPVKILITDLTNRALPIIRYDIGDSAVPGEGKCECGRGLPVMKGFAGRVSKLIDLPDGRTIHSLDFWYIFRKAGEIKPDGLREFQVKVVYPKEFIISIIPGKQFDDEIMGFLKYRIGFALGDKADITYKLVDDIAPTKSGKYDKIIIENNGRSTGV